MSSFLEYLYSCGKIVGEMIAALIVFAAILLFHSAVSYLTQRFSPPAFVTHAFETVENFLFFMDVALLVSGVLKELRTFSRSA